jgi:hypothetical protein
MITFRKLRGAFSQAKQQIHEALGSRNSSLGFREGQFVRQNLTVILSERKQPYFTSGSPYQEKDYSNGNKAAVPSDMWEALRYVLSQRQRR